MKLQRLTSTTGSITREAAEQARAVAREEARRVNPAEGTSADRERSLQQELEAAADKVPAAENGERSLQEARQVAGELVNLGKEATRLLKAPGETPGLPSVDTEA